MASPWGPQRREPQKAKIRNAEKYFGRNGSVFVLNRAHILHEFSNTFPMIPHSRGRPRALKRPLNLVLFLGTFQF